MSDRIDATSREVITAAEWVAIATTGPDGPHLVATWGDYVRTLGVEGDRILVPVGGMHKTEENLRRDPRVEVLFASRQVPGAHGPGRGCCVTGTAEVVAAGAAFEQVKARFPWARAVLVVTATNVERQL